MVEALNKNSGRKVCLSVKLSPSKKIVLFASMEAL